MSEHDQPTIPLNERLYAACDAAMLAIHEATGDLATLRVIVAHGVLPHGLGEVMLRGVHGECAIIDAACFEELRAETEAKLRDAGEHPEDFAD